MNVVSEIARKYWLVTIPAVFCASPVHAAGQGMIAVPEPVGIGEALSVAGGLVSVIAAVLLIGFLYSRLRGPHTGGNNAINIIGSRALGSKERIVLVEIAGTQLVVGMTASQVRTLHVFDEPVVTVEDNAAGFNFAERLKHALGGDRK